MHTVMVCIFCFIVILLVYLQQMCSNMMTLQEIRKIYLNTKNVSKFNKILFILCITKIHGYSISSLNPKDITLNMKFVFWNPLTYIYLLLMFLLHTFIFMFDGGLNEMWRMAKNELVEGFYEFL